MTSRSTSNGDAPIAMPNPDLARSPAHRVADESIQAGYRQHQSHGAHGPHDLDAGARSFDGVVAVHVGVCPRVGNRHVRVERVDDALERIEELMRVARPIA